MEALIVYLVVGLVAQAIGFPIATLIRGHKKRAAMKKED